MQWKKRVAGNRKYEWMAIFGTFILLIGATFNRPILFLLVGILLVYIVLGIFYDRKAGEKLTLENPKQKIRLFPDQQEEIELSLVNKSNLPIINGKLAFQVKEVLAVKHYAKGQHINMIQSEVPLSIMSRGKTKLSLAVEAKKRGTTRISHINYRFPHLTSFRWIFMRFQPVFQTEVIIFPKSLPVYGLEEKFYQVNGDQRTNFSPFEDVMSPIGTRDYVPSDPFHRVHWKASARKQALQTKVLEKNNDQTWHLVINVSSRSPLGNPYWSDEVENLLSYVTYVCQVLTKRRLPFALHLNTIRGGKLDKGEGKEQLRHALDLLAYVNEGNGLLNTTRFLHQIEHSQPQNILYFGDVVEDDIPILLKWKQLGMTVYHVVGNDGGATLRSRVQVGDVK
ncbi:DUF58 domain-containing protein [Salinibacillus xinjiangensis]|uniref:DUF58 domain-containing protein n=1 Tax=Salinibacillus xinjiangensis TaxID=1229268 RepID=A0A6G1X2G9_9BACI|nr:DUF58 domain-containing protein [Salinibacillus xinjiangensis]MRG85134.1 DUF58 domain-containing protein [Salinibacillus xinjiangensis]